MQKATVSCQGLTVWFTGLSGAGKSTLCRLLEPELVKGGYPVQVLDADEIRDRLHSDIGYSKPDRDENVRRISNLARNLVRQNFVVLVASISPYRQARAEARERIGRFLEVYVNASLTACIERDTKKLYARALRGELRLFTGISDPYEPPIEPDVECKTEIESCEESTKKVLGAIRHIQQSQLFPTIEQLQDAAP